jgi:GTP pyrophosphokinase
MRVILDVPRLEGESDEAFSARGEAACYHVVSRIRAMSGWAPSTGGFKDYILAKKGNGYSSLHQYMHNQALDTHLEVQVRTRDMHVQAELGEAAHWNYKDTLYRPEIANSKYYKIAWRSKEQAHARSAAELIGLAKKQLNAQRVFVFLNDESTVLNLRKGATALDAAFAIHTSIGLSVKGIKVSGTPVGLKRVMQNGDVISVECEASAVTAEPSWLGYTKLAYSRTNIRRYLRQKHADTILQYTISKQTATPVFAVASNQHVCEPAVVEEEAPSRPFTFHKFSPTLLRVQPRALARSATSKAQKPFSLEAASLTLPLQRLARQHVAASIMRSQLA